MEAAAAALIRTVRVLVCPRPCRNTWTELKESSLVPAGARWRCAEHQSCQEACGDGAGLRGRGPAVTLSACRVRALELEC